MKRIFVDLAACNGCRTCETACQVEHSKAKRLPEALLESPRPLSRLFVEAGPGGQPVPVLCRHCADAPCVGACLTGAMHYDRRGLVTNQNGPSPCIGCWMCVQACPYGAVQPDVSGSVAVKCDGCPDLTIPACVTSCPHGALRYEEVTDFAAARRDHAVAGTLGEVI